MKSDKGVLFSPIVHLQAPRGEMRKGSGMAKRNILDELERRVREWLKDLDQALNPRQPERVKVPVPVRVNPERQRPQ